MKPILTLLIAAAVAQAATTYTYTATGTANPFTNGSDPFGNPWLIRDFGGDVHFGIPGIFTGGPTIWSGPDCLSEILVSAKALLPGSTGVPLAPDNASTQLFRNVSDNYNYAYSISNNVIHFVAAPGFEIHTGDTVNAWTFFTNPYPPGTQFQFDVTYVCADCGVPEPTSFALLGAGLIGMSLLKRRRLANH
jgi:hypothetical protein